MVRNGRQYGRKGKAPVTRSRPGALVTGASSGIGYELSKILAREGHDLALVARSADRLETIAGALRDDFGVQVVVVSVDLSDPGAPDRVFDRLREAEFTVDVLVNNAGFGTMGRFVRSDTGAQVDMVEVNITALTHLTRLYAERMLERGQGRIMNVASTAAFQPGPFMAVYFATKAYVLSFSEALAEELRDTGVTVTALCPGPTVTGFQKRAGMEHSPIGGRMVTADAASVARAGYAGMMKGKRLVIPGLFNRLGTMSPRFFPRALATRIVARMTAVRGEA
ncbi:MAG: SDR family oxidoreductase [Gemmatimonadetes bacterium]|nr:SDR family oxidoreductase [Gemmatimonadota bacterium]NNK49349.1 SDR family oxidoreductase [Gemmatimonadota bacterium]